MTSPFPGMDPYLERYWGDVHHSLIQYTRDVLVEGLPGDLRARVEERVYLEDEAGMKHQFVPDAHVALISSTRGWTSATQPQEGVLALAEPLVYRVSHDPITEGYIEITERLGGKVITVIEFLSPANKLHGPGRVAYKKKQRNVLRSDASLVEIDLVRRGPRSLSLPYDDLPPVTAAAYVAAIRPGWDRELYEVFPISLRQRLPALPIPLRPHEARLALDLQPLLDRAYKAGRYSDTNYTQPPDPPLESGDAEWARGLLEKR